MLPLILDLTGRRVVIFGGGPVGARKARYFLGECKVTVVSRSFSGEIHGMDVERAAVDLGSASDQHLKNLMEGAFLVVAAIGDPALNNRILRIAREAGIPCDTVSGEQGDVIIPAVCSGRHHLVAVTTFGRSPATARYLRERFSGDAERTDQMIELQERAREALKGLEPSQERRAAILHEILADRAAWEILSRNRDSAWEYIRRRYLHG
ncbi:MAG TPA: bifunctional precorrin-2 dehydrogenase/sirohydrochlorin ferrochelatase [Methanomicrobiales archaeon]|nr:bifunctional precorrin-2 dehydrogenase/sirohydrochlorin ferrochelatase [Methanomicrobiales archaeon]